MGKSDKGLAAKSTWHSRRNEPGEQRNESMGGLQNNWLWQKSKIEKSIILLGDVGGHDGARSKEQQMEQVEPEQ
jgi:hypothetical protein